MVSTQIFFIFTPNLGEDEPILIHIFGMGWNHQLAYVYYQGVVMLRVQVLQFWKETTMLESHIRRKPHDVK